MSSKIKGFDGLRGISVLLVIMSHAVIWPIIGITSPALLSILSPHVGVSTFFMLSGFLITFLLLKEKETTGSIDIFSFIKRRALRIFPLYYLAIFFLTLMDLTGKAGISNCIYPYALTYTINFAPKACAFSAMSHFWSLSVEEHFYLFWPLVFALGKRTAIITVSLIAVGCLYFGTNLYEATTLYYLNRWSFPAMLPILVGCITAFVCNHQMSKTVFNNASISGILLISILSGLASPAFIKTEAIWLLSVSALILYIYNNQHSLLVKLLELKPLAAIGIISYGLYVWQGVFTGNGPYRTEHEFPPSVNIGLWLTFIVAPLSYIFFEKPILKLKKKYTWQEKRILDTNVSGAK
ncbi:acyltransferase [Pseudomonas sp. SAICEU22]|uniref:Acyltransferase n=1 Tax=Pseudomonas agronomica TaxID=2979328 RepID=A0ABT3F6N8_9PSED|nr:acyltransferase [Pseudomonas agronomica]MCW1244319.1 acyltransferase [Pseudomonas agronomica]